MGIKWALKQATLALKLRYKMDIKALLEVLNSKDVNHQKLIKRPNLLMYEYRSIF